MPDKTALDSPMVRRSDSLTVRPEIDSNGKDMENYESVGVEQIELDIVESAAAMATQTSKATTKNWQLQQIKGISSTLARNLPELLLSPASQDIQPAKRPGRSRSRSEPAKPLATCVDDTQMQTNRVQ
ncbi:hypothetical protein ACLKA7_014920 [Drosophila subpalustris]